MSEEVSPQRDNAVTKALECCLRACGKQIVGGACGFFHGLILLRNRHLPVLTHKINAMYMYMKWRAGSR